MALTFGPNLGLLVDGTAGEEHYDELMAFFRGLDALIQPFAVTRNNGGVPGSPTNGQKYIVHAGASGAWSGHDNKIARWSSVLSAWEFFAPTDGWRCYVFDEAVSLIYKSGAWQRFDSPLLVGISAQAGTSYTFVLGDAYGKVVRFSAATAVTATLPLHATLPIPVGSVITCRQVGDGQVTIVVESGGGTINIPTGYLAKTGRKHATLMLHKVNDNLWDITGDLAPA
jgi:hypothetical protein